MTLESLTLLQIGCFANSDNLDVSEFGHRALRFLNLAVKHEPTFADLSEMRQLHEVLTRNLANPECVLELREAEPGAFADEDKIAGSEYVPTVTVKSRPIVPKSRIKIPRS